MTTALDTSEVEPLLSEGEVPLTDPVAISHNGTVLVFAREAKKPVEHLYYNVRIAGTGPGDMAAQWGGWTRLDMTEPVRDKDPKEPSADEHPQHRLAGMDLVTVPPVATTPAPADAPFGVVSDGQYVSCLRQSTAGTLYLDRFLLVETPGTVSDDRTQATGVTTYDLQRAWEVRYRRSGRRDAPDGTDDTLDYRDMLNLPFLEPTIEIAGVPGIPSVRFAVLLAPAATASGMRWHLFTVANDRIQATSFPRDENGLLDPSPATAHSFSIAPAVVMPDGSTQALQCLGGVAATLYHEQEKVNLGEPTSSSLRRATRIMVTAPVANASIGLPQALAVFDFLVEPAGTIPAFPTGAGCVLVDGSLQSGKFTPLQAASYPVPSPAVHVVGTATVYGVLLGQPQPSATPFLLDSADGLVHCYLAGQPGKDQGPPFLVAQYDPVVTRATVEVPWQATSQSGKLAFVAERSGSTFDQLHVTVSDCAGEPDLCDLAIDYGAPAGLPVESWKGVPRELDALVAILNGAASSNPADPRVQSGAVPFYDYGGHMQMARLPLTQTTTPSGFLTLPSRRPDVRVSAVSVAAPQSTTTDIKLSFSSSNGTITQTWSRVPTDTSELVPILLGEAAPSTYGYAPDPNDTPVYGIATDGGTILLFASARDIGITVSSASDLDPAHCDVSVVQGKNPPTPLKNVPRDQAGFVAALLKDKQISALFSHISPDPVAGTVGNGVTSKPLDLRGASILLGVLAPAVPAPVVQVDVQGAVVQGHSLNPPPDPTPNRMLALSAIPVDVPTLGETALVQNGSRSPSAPAQNGAWVAAETRTALRFGGKNAMTVDLSKPSALQLRPRRTWTIESWVAPAQGAPSRVISYNDGPAKVLAGVVPSYLLGTTGLPALEYEPFTPKQPRSSSYVNVPANPVFNLSAAPAFTWEAWIKPDAPPCPVGVLGCVVQGQDTVVSVIPQFELGLSNQLELTFGYRNGPTTESKVATKDSLQPSTWTHVAVVGAARGVTWTFTLYVNGKVAATQTDATLYPTPASPYVCIGANDLRNVSLFGSLAEVRYWKTARSQAELRRTMYASLTGLEPGLVGYWPLTDDIAKDNTIKNDAVATGTALNGALQRKDQPVKSSSDGTFLAVVAAVGGAPPLIARGFLRSNRWNHVAVVYEAGTAVSLNPTASFDAGRLDYGVCKKPTGLSVSNQASFEAWVQMEPATGTPQTILSQWGPKQPDQSYQLGVGADGRPFLNVTVANTFTGALTPLTVAGPTAVTDGKPHHVVGTYEAVKGVDVNNLPIVTCTLTLYVDGVQQPPTTKQFQTPSISVVSSSVPFSVGISALVDPSQGTVAIETQAPFRGVLTGVRFWSVALSPLQVKAAMDELDSYDTAGGVVSAWWFAEQKDRVAADPISGNDLTLSDVDLWAAFASFSDTTCYANGVAIGQIGPAPADTTVGYQGETQLTVGARRQTGSIEDGLVGPLAELRLWNTARTGSELGEAMYRPLRGDEQGLVAYWSFGDGTTKDDTPHGNDGTLVGSPAPAFVPSTAPVANEGPQVRNVYGGPVTDFQEPLDGTPAVIEYADTGVRADDTHFAVMRRDYDYTNPKLELVTGYGMGELELVYIGQVQTNPTLIGFIEGAPPVPSENLSRPFYGGSGGSTAYFDTTTVTLTQQEATAVSFSSSDYRTSLAFDLDVKGGVFGTTTLTVNTPFLADKAFTAKVKVGAQHKSSLVEASQFDDRYMSSWTKTLTDTLRLRGAFEPEQSKNADYLNPLVGRRFQPANLGYALVESLTADLFSMRSRVTGAMVGKVAIPNLSIPPDKNVIVFQIRPQYVKNGTLDGKVGLVNDPTYPNADVERGSYFKAAEAYRLKAAIERRERSLQTFFDQLDPGARTGLLGPDTSGVAEEQFYDFKTQVARKSVVNSYVWTANGGLHSEEEQFAATHDRTYTGFYDYTHRTGVTVEVEWAFKVGVFGGFDLLFGGQVRVQVAKAETSSRSLSMSVSNSCDPTLAAWDPALNDGAGGFTPAPCPGKVDAYRFMTFYLEPGADNADAFLDDVVDDNWLKFSSDPNAIALRGAQIRGNPMWRVLHRVTYVSRVPPEIDSSPDQTVAKHQDGAIAVADNPWLIALVLDALGKRPATPANIGNAVATVMAPLDGSKSRLGQIVPWWQAFVDSTRVATPDPAAVALLNQILLDTATYIQKGFRTKALPPA